MLRNTMMFLEDKRRASLTASVKLFTVVASFFISTFFYHAMAQKAVLDHIAIYVVDLKKSVSFYQEVMELDSIPEPFHDGRHAWFSVAQGVQLHIIQGADNKSDLPKRNHICFSFSSLTPFMERLKKAGMVWEDLQGKANAITTRPDGVLQIYFRDPDGYWIEANDAAKK